MADDQQHATNGRTATDEQQTQRISPWAIAGIIVAVLLGPLGLLVNGYALHRIGQTGERGQALAAVGIGISVIVTIFSLVLVGSISFVTSIDY